MKNKKVELLAPAGNMESLKAAVAAGCDAVYLGLQSFSARAFAGNFSHEELMEAVRYAHIHDVKVYVTINTMLFEKEIERAKEEVDFLYHQDVDALLVQDAGLFDYIRHVYPDFDLHCSTQMHIHNPAGVKLMQELGAKRVVMARETPVERIREACETGMDIEVFCYGAICISYSGQCLMSAAVKNRSANRGMCAQCCRLKYYPDRNHRFEEGDYILSPKDLNVIDRLPELIRAGVASLKIEGRMKRPEYVWLAVHTFRNAIDAYYAGKTYHPDSKTQKALLEMFNRGFSEGHLFHAGLQERMSQYRPNHQGIEIGRVTDFQNGRVQVKLTDSLHQHDGLRIINEPHDTGLTAVKIYKNGKLTDHAEKGDTVWLECHSEPHPKKGQILRRTSDTVLLKEIDAQIMMPKRIPVSMQYTAEPGSPLVLTVTDPQGNRCTASSDIPCEQAQKAPLTSEKICASLTKTGDFSYEVSSINGQADNIFLPVSALNDTRRKALEQLDQKRAVRHERKGKQKYDLTIQQPVKLPYRLFVKGDDSFRKEDVLHLTEANTRPVVDEAFEGEDSSCRVLSSMNDLYGKHIHCIAGITLNIANSYAIAFFLSHGCDGVMLSSEMNDAEIKDALDAFKNRYGFVPFTIQLVYGKRTVMYIKDRFMKEEKKSMVDAHGQVYELAYNRDITMIREPEPVHRRNNLADASLILFSHEKNKKEILEEAYEEILERV